MTKNKNKILVTGGLGYIGSHTVIELLNLDYEVLIADNLSNSDIRVLDSILKITGKKPEFIEIDFCNRKLTELFFENHKDIYSIIHFAAFKAVGESVEFPLKYYRNNLFSLINVLDGMLNNDIRNIVFSSSCTVYGQPDKMPVTEKTPIKHADSPYGNTKQMSEEIIRDFCIANQQTSAVCLRYFNPIGAHESAIIGELPTGIPNNLVPFIMQTAIGLRKELLVFGDDYQTEDGTAIRDYIHVCDLAAAHVSAIKRFDKTNKETNFEVFNVGTGKGTSVMEIIDEFQSVSGVKLNYRITERRKGDIVKIWADTSYAETELNWKAVRSIKEALSSAWEWEKYLRKNS